MTCTEGEVLAVRWMPWQVVLSYIVVAYGSFGAVVVLDHARLCDGTRPNFGIFHMPYAFAATSLGAGIWGMHFLGMGARRLVSESTGEEIEVQYELFLTLLSLALCCACNRLGFWQASNDIYFASDRASRLKTVMLAKYDKNVPALRSRENAIRWAYFGKLTRICLAAVLIAGGMLTMHFSGIASLHGPFRVKWNFGILALSVVLALVVALAGVWILFRLLVWKPTLEMLRVGAAAVIGLAACSMHYTGMYAASYHCDKDSTWLRSGFFWKCPSPSFEFVIVILTLNLAIIALLSVAVDLRTNFLPVNNTNFSHFMAKIKLDPNALQQLVIQQHGSGGSEPIPPMANFLSGSSVRRGGGSERRDFGTCTTKDGAAAHAMESSRVELTVRQQQLVIQQRGERKLPDEELASTLDSNDDA